MITAHSFKKTKNNFYEKQKFRSVALFSVLLIFEAVCIFLCVKQVLSHKPWGLSSITSPESLYLIIFTLSVPTPLLLGFYLVSLETIVNDEGVFYRWRPFKKGYYMVQWEYVKQVSIIHVEHPGLFGNLAKKYGDSNYLGGGVGMQITMKSGKRKLFSTRKAEELNRTLTRLPGVQYTPSTVGHNLDYSD